ncbi:hypothetical protein SAMD00019534_051660 [Acytostelium subglobosum LB1]|uniref:hypothetical protein n=1 Tax=Acytostelium subglobosum LB1 TaxID=1410327 RepID=UPI000645109C|nr:hypothetical protein SAMD00019534_051660 [Acytostelium subglobosum LB1]GAM21991.1 hypothetical protein SAMD00019534_051660 [Acytostelium subglobosum LB1]|eukprot:XP_012755091.1 hypothetical protein SAMD00019534_051660 [Acytostelium subglobosum LB1]
MYKSFIAICLLFVVVANADIWTNCGTPSDKFTITNVVITPDPPIKGQEIVVSASGTLSETVTGGTAHMTVKYGFITVLNKQENLCDIPNSPYPCPIAAGPYSRTVNATIPGNVPGGSYKINVVLNDENNAEIACIDVAVKFEGKGEGKGSCNMSNKQTTNERRQIRREYRLLIQDTQSKRQDLIQPENNGLSELLKKGEDIYSRVQHPREAALDSELLSLASQLGLEQSQKFKVTFNSFDSEGFITRVRDHLMQLSEDNDVNEQGWNRFGQAVNEHYNTVPEFDFMYGPMNIEIVEKQRKQIQRRAKEDVGKVEHAEKVTDTETANAESTSGRVQAMKQYIEKKRRIDFLDMVVNKQSFSKTVENIFYLSFLLKDGQARISNTDGFENVEASQPPDEKDYTTGKALQRHSIIKMDYETWQMMTKLTSTLDDFDITQRPQPVVSVTEPARQQQDDRANKRQRK